MTRPRRWQRPCDYFLPLCAGPERSVAATKSYLMAAFAFLQLVAHWKRDAKLLRMVTATPQALDDAMGCDWSDALARLNQVGGLYVIARGLGNGAALEMALKCKETCRLHAEAFSAAEVIHGPLALVGPDFPVIALTQHDPTEDANRAVIARMVGLGATVLSTDMTVKDVIALPTVPDLPAEIAPLAQTLSFYLAIHKVARARGLDPDVPPNLKKVTETVWMRQMLTGARIFTGDAMLDDHALVLDGDRILDLVPARDAPNLQAGTILAPGFIDTQVNGGGGVLFNQTPTAGAIRTIAAAHRRFGTTSLLPTLITDAFETMPRAVAAAKEAGTGIHLEGPFISLERRGVHEARFVRSPTPEDLDFLCGLPAELPHVLVSVAPETVEPAAIARLVKADVVVAGAHSAASYEQTRDALARGMTGFTHLFNAMPPLANRAPGIAGAALDDDASWCGLIVDGVHVHPAMLKLALPRGKLFLVTDSMPPLGTDATSFELYGHAIHRRDGKLVTDDGTLAGADLDMAQAVRNTVSMLGSGSKKRCAWRRSIRHNSWGCTTAAELPRAYARIWSFSTRRCTCMKPGLAARPRSLQRHPWAKSITMRFRSNGPETAAPHQRISRLRSRPSHCCCGQPRHSRLRRSKLSRRRRALESGRAAAGFDQRLSQTLVSASVRRCRRRGRRLSRRRSRDDGRRQRHGRPLHQRDPAPACDDRSRIRCQARDGTASRRQPQMLRRQLAELPVAHEPVIEVA